MRLLLLSLVLAGCAAEATATDDFDDAAYQAEAQRAGCIDGKCDDGGSDWSRGRLPADEMPPLLNATWDDDAYARWNHQDQGVMLIPYSWALALEQPDSKEPFLSADYVGRFGFLGAAPTPYNPDGLPVGFTVRVQGGQKFFGFAC